MTDIDGDVHSLEVDGGKLSIRIRNLLGSEPSGAANARFHVQLERQLAGRPHVQLAKRLLSFFRTAPPSIIITIITPSAAVGFVPLQ